MQDDGTYGWLESEGALLILELVEQDTGGDRSLAVMDLEFDDVEAEIISRAKASIPAWTRRVAHQRSTKSAGRVVLAPA